MFSMEFPRYIIQNHPSVSLSIVVHIHVCTETIHVDVTEYVFFLCPLLEIFSFCLSQIHLIINAIIFKANFNVIVKMYICFKRFGIRE